MRSGSMRVEGKPEIGKDQHRDTQEAQRDTEKGKIQILK
jgi:hypothetical protein